MPLGIPQSTFGEIVDFFFSIFGGSESPPVKGILQGALSPSPVLTCSVDQRVQLEDILKPGSHKVQVTALNEEAENMTWEAENAADGRTYTGAAWADLIGPERATSHSSLVIAQPLKEPAFYQVDVQPVGANTPKASLWVLIAPESMCKPLRDSYQQAVSFTKTWTKDTPSEAVMNFRLRYLEGLAAQPERAPLGKGRR
jgi:hypothetical protein